MNLSAILKTAQGQLEKAGITNASFDARLLVAYALNIERIDLVRQSNRVLTDNEQIIIEKLIRRRAAHEPVGRIVAFREFWGLPFRLNEATLEPRPDSETLIEAALTISPRHNIRILDLGTGTGCLLLSLLYELPNASGVGIDIAPRAIDQATENAKRLGLDQRATFLQGNWFGPVEGVFDLIISNPPYIKHNDIALLEREVREHDPMAALDGGEDGYDPYRHLIPQLDPYLAEKGFILFEIGQGQESTILNLIETAGFSNITNHKDLGGIIRVIRAQKGC